MVALITLGVCVALFCFYMIYRNWQILRLRLEMLDIIRELGLKDINAGRKSLSQKRIDALMSVTQDQMLHKFWLPVEAKYYYNDLWFLEAKDE